MKKLRITVLIVGLATLLVTQVHQIRSFSSNRSPDLNRDGIVDARDLSILLSAYGRK